MLSLDRDAIAQLCREFGVRRLAVFGSAVTERFNPERSDVDFLVEFADSAPQTLSHYFRFKGALEALVDRSVDLVEAGALRNPFIIESIEASKEDLYAA
ncbi:nucleotidyltransferase family protein [Nakamurella aerolata]|uniref:nucleotidyltransferase family protein n=1 Tax=Nakamurella aerolata TaxID=1656892 RepID=UPI001BB2A280